MSYNVSPEIVVRICINNNNTNTNNNDTFVECRSAIASEALAISSIEQLSF